MHRLFVARVLEKATKFPLGRHFTLLGQGSRQASPCCSIFAIFMLRKQTDLPDRLTAKTQLQAISIACCPYREGKQVSSCCSCAAAEAAA
jgi:hypothetical protein